MQKIINFIFHKNSIVFLLMMLANLTNYLFQIMAGHMVSIEDYGTINFLLNILNIIAIPMCIISTVSSRFINLYLSTKQKDVAADFLKYISRASLLLAVLILGVGLLITNSIVHYTQIPKAYFVLITIYSFLIIFQAPFTGALQGCQKLIAYGISNSLASLTKLMVSFLLFYWGYSVIGAIGGNITSIIITLIFSFFILGYLLIEKPHNTSFHLADYIPYVGQVFIMQVLFSILLNSDMLLIHYLAESDYVAGLYSAGLTICKIQIYLVTTITSIIFPSITSALAKNMPTFQLLVKALLVGGGLSLSYSITICLLGKYLVTLLFPERYLESIPLFFPICCFIFPISLLLLILNHFTAIARVSFFAVSLIIGFCIIIILTLYFTLNVNTIFYICGILFTIIIILNLIYAYNVNQVI